MALGWETAQPDIDEVYDLVARDPATGKWFTMQIKTVRIRSDRDGALVVYARKGNGQPYQPHEVDFLIGVHGDQVYMFECTGNAEYWCTEASVKRRWLNLTDQEAV